MVARRLPVQVSLRPAHAPTLLIFTNREPRTANRYLPPSHGRMPQTPDPLAEGTPVTTVFDFSATSLAGKPVQLKDYAGKPLLIVNTASKCGFTPQYAGLEEVFKRFGERGLVVMGFPCN